MRTTVAAFSAAGEDIMPHWAALSTRATPNVFMHPAALKVVHATRFAQVHVLCAWLGAARERLIGMWAIQRSHLTTLGPSFLAAPPYNYAFVSNPVLDPEFMDEAVSGFFDLLASDNRLPNVVRLRYLDADCPSYAAILGALAARGARSLEVSRRERPFATKAAGLKHAGATRSKLRQKWNRLCAAGAVELKNDRSPDAVPAAFETYLALEAASWKGQRGTALLSDKRDAEFTRQLIAALASEGSASVALLTMDGRAIAAQVVLYCGCRGYTWKTAFDAAFGTFSPGALLVDKVTERLFAMDGIQSIESCSPEGSFMDQLWQGRRATVDLVADLGAARSLEFSALAMGARSYAQLRDMRRTLRTSSQPVISRRDGR